MKKKLQRLKNFFLELTHISTTHSLVRTVVFTVGHFIIDITTNYVITGAPLELIAISAMLSPLLNAIWYFILDKYVFSKIYTKYKTKC